MAIWQYRMILLPKESLVKHLGELHEKVNDKDYNRIDFWAGTKYSSSIFSYFDQILPKNKSWSDEIILYGDTNSNCIEIVEENDSISEAIIRIDFRTEYSLALNAVLEFCILNSLILLDNNLRIMDLNETNINVQIFNSKEYKKYKVLEDQ